MICEVCGKKEATVLYTHVAGNEKKSVHMCGDCVAAHKVKLRGGAAHKSAPTTPKGTESRPEKTEGAQEAGLRCRYCGASQEDFRKRGRFGCHRCYESFESDLGRLLKRIHGSLEHCGKGKGGNQAPGAKCSELDDLKRALARAVTAEAYEQAAKLRDRIHHLSGGTGVDMGGHTGAVTGEDG